MLYSMLTTDEAKLREFGKRLAACRLRNNWTQTDLAEKAGVGKSTVARIENGVSSQSLSLAKIFAVLGLVPSFESFLPQTEPSPMEVLKMQGKLRRRASGKRKNASDSVREPGTKWVWGEDR
ncbi:MAG: helix-turn-helix transcriptional regulator [Fibrobacteraceae bacterium]